MSAAMAPSSSVQGNRLRRVCVAAALLSLVLELPCCEAVRMKLTRTAERAMANRTAEPRNFTPSDLNLSQSPNSDLVGDIVTTKGKLSDKTASPSKPQHLDQRAGGSDGNATSVAQPTGTVTASVAAVKEATGDIDTTKGKLSYKMASPFKPQHLDQHAGGSDGFAASVVQQTGAVTSSVAAIKEEVTVDPLSYFTNHPDELVPLIFSIFCFLAFVSVVFFHGNGRSQVERIRREKDRVSKAYHATIGEMQGLLNNMSESSACFAQRNFNAKRRTFQRFLEKMKKGPAKYHQKDYALVSPFREFVSSLLTIWKQCTIDPISDPQVVVKREELQACETVAQVAELVERRLEKSTVEIVAETMDQVGHDVFKKVLVEEQPDEHSSWIGFGCVGVGLRWPQSGEKIEQGRVGPSASSASAYEDDDDEHRYPVDILLGLMRMTLLSESHARFLGGLLCGGAIIAWELYINKVIWALIVGCGEVCLLILVFGFQEFDQIAQLTKAIGQLRKEAKILDEQHKKMIDSHSKLQMVTSLWLYRTVPRLDNMLELAESIVDTPEHLRLVLLEGLNRSLHRIEKAMGPLELYCGANSGEKSLPEDKLVLVAEQLNDCTRYIHNLQATDSLDDIETIPQILFRMERVLAFVYVRIIKAYHLTNKNYEFALLGHKSHPYVTLQMESTGEQPPRTATIENNLNPSWEHEEFFFPAQALDSKLELHVWNASEVADHSSLGFVRVDFRKMESGVWHRRQDKLMSLRKGHEKESELEYEVYYANELTQLLDVNSATVLHEEHTQQLSVFLGE